VSAARRVESLLAGKELDGAGLGYDLEGDHLGIVAVGPGAAATVGTAATSLERRSLVVEARDGALWGWLGPGDETDSEYLNQLLGNKLPEGSFAGLGEPASGPEGWRLTHRQARAALTVARRGGESIVRYAEVPLLATMLRDDLLATSLWRLYLAPLEDDPNGGDELRRTLRAYFAAGRNASRAAAELGITRQAVMRRVRATERKIGRSIDSCGAELEVALRFEALETTTRLRA
jgi:hypothetical protein